MAGKYRNSVHDNSATYGIRQKAFRTTVPENQARSLRIECELSHGHSKGSFIFGQLRHAHHPSIFHATDNKSHLEGRMTRMFDVPCAVLDASINDVIPVWQVQPPPHVTKLNV